MNEQTEYIIDLVLSYLSAVREQLALFDIDPEKACGMAQEIGGIIDGLLHEGATHEQLDALIAFANAGITVSKP